MSRTHAQYVTACPDTPEHMMRLGPAHLESVFVGCMKDRFCDFPGGFLRITITDVRLYPNWLRRGWLKTHKDTPFRIYVNDYDDWNTEKSYATEAEAREVLELLKIGAPLQREDFKALGLRTS